MTEHRAEVLEAEVEAMKRARSVVVRAPSLEWLEERLAAFRTVLERRTVESATLLRRLLGKITLEPMQPETGAPYYVARTALDVLVLLDPDGPGPDPDPGARSLRWWTRSQRLRTVVRVPIEASLREVTDLPIYQRIAPEAARLREAGLSDHAIGLRFRVSDKTAAKAIRWFHGHGRVPCFHSHEYDPRRPSRAFGTRRTRLRPSASLARRPPSGPWAGAIIWVLRPCQLLVLALPVAVIQGVASGQGTGFPGPFLAHFLCVCRTVDVVVRFERLMTGLARAPSPERLNVAVGLIVERLAPDQIILFGSAARGEMTAESDLDLLVIRDDDGGGALFTRHERWRCPTNGDQLDVVVMTRAMAECHRMSASYVQGPALEEGRTLYLREGVTPTATGPIYTWNGVEMVKTTQFVPDHAAELLDKASRKWVDANRTEHPADRCDYLQRSIEHALKALITADGRRVDHTHELDALWQQVEATGEAIGATRNPSQLEKLSRYAGEWRYDAPVDEDPEATWQENRTTGEDVLNDARVRVPGLIKQTRQALASQSGEHGARAVGGTPRPHPVPSPPPARGTAAKPS